FAGVGDALGDFHSQVARHQRGVGTPMDVVDVGFARGAGDLQHIAESAGGDQAYVRFGAFDNQIGGKGAGVEKAVDARHRDAGQFGDLLDTVDDAQADVLRRGGHLGGQYMGAVQ